MARQLGVGAKNGNGSVGVVLAIALGVIGCQLEYQGDLVGLSYVEGDAGAADAPCGLDSDGDGVLDCSDFCKFTPGPAESLGCPGDTAIDASGNDGDVIDAGLVGFDAGAAQDDGGSAAWIDGGLDGGSSGADMYCGDVDIDGIDDCHDLCPTVPEDFDGHLDDDGCPESELDASTFSADAAPPGDAEADAYGDAGVDGAVLSDTGM